MIPYALAARLIRNFHGIQYLSMSNHNTSEEKNIWGKRLIFDPDSSDTSSREENLTGIKKVIV
jgi:hypothetical protein